MERTRLDKWLWAARFFKTRSQATDAVSRGKVRLNNATTKPAHDVKLGDVLRVEHGDQTIELHIVAISDTRRGAPEARLLYTETASSQAQRERVALQHKLAPEPSLLLHGRPTKRQRRAMDGLFVA